jgi:hypothetical protein
MCHTILKSERKTGLNDVSFVLIRKCFADREASDGEAFESFFYS